jgi:hypothetical protein
MPAAGATVMSPSHPPLAHVYRSIGDDAEIDFGPISAGGVSSSAAAGLYDKQPSLGVGNRAVGL